MLHSPPLETALSSRGSDRGEKGDGAAANCDLSVMVDVPTVGVDISGCDLSPAGDVNISVNEACSIIYKYIDVVI